MSFDVQQGVRDSVLVRRFGEPVTYTSIATGSKTITGFFQNPSRPSEIGLRSMQSAQPMVTVLKSDVPDLRTKDQFSIRDMQYRVVEINGDEGEAVVVTLEELV